MNFRNNEFQPCALWEVQPTCWVLCSKGECYALCMADQRLFISVQKVGFTSQEAPVFLSLQCSLGLCSEWKGLPCAAPSPFPTALESVSVTSWQSSAAGFSFESFLKAGNTEEVPWRLKAACAVAWPLLHPHLALCQGHWGSHVTKPDLQMQKNLPAPTLATLVPSYWSQFCSLKARGFFCCCCFLIRSDDRKDLVDTELQQNLQLGICDIPDIKKARNAHFTLSYLNSALNQGCFIKHLELLIALLCS